MHRGVPIAACIAAATMAAALGFGIARGDLAAEGAVLLAMPWGVTALVEIYVGMALFGGWVLWRERSLTRSGAWLLAIAVLGNLVSCVYVLLALRCAGGDAARFWMGARVDVARQECAGALAGR